MNLLRLTIQLSKDGLSVKDIAIVLRQVMISQGKTEEQIALLLGEPNGNNR